MLSTPLEVVGGCYITGGRATRLALATFLRPGSNTYSDSPGYVFYYTTLVMSHSVDFTKFKFPIPDYSNGTTIPNATNTWTAPKCGVVVAALVADTTNGYKNVTISVNGKVVAKALWAGVTGGYNSQTTAIVPVATGDVVKFSATDGQSKVDGRVFYPYKWG